MSCCGSSRPCVPPPGQLRKPGMLVIPGFSLPGFFLHPADCPSLRTGKGRKRGFDKRESLGRERGRFGGGEGTFLKKGSLSPSKPSHPSPFIRLDDTGGKKETSSFTTIEGTCHVSHPHAFIGPGLQALHGRALHRRVSARSTASNGSSSSPAMKTLSEPLRWSSIRWKRMSDWHSAIRRPETPAL